MREIGSSVRFLRDKFVPLYSERGYSDKDIRNKEVLALFSCGFVPFLSRQNFVSWCKILQVADLKRLVRMIKGRISLTTRLGCAFLSSSNIADNVGATYQCTWYGIDGRRAYYENQHCKFSFKHFDIHIFVSTLQFRLFTLLAFYYIYNLYGYYRILFQDLLLQSLLSFKYQILY